MAEPSSLDSTRQASQKDGGGGGPVGTDRGHSVGGVASPPPMWHLPTIIGWRESIVRRKVFCCLTKAAPKVMNRLSSNFSLDIDAIQSGALQLADVFPRCNETPLDIPNRTANGIAYRASNGRARTLSSSLSPALDRSVSSPSLPTMLRSRSSSTPMKMRRPSASPEIIAALSPASICSTPQPASKSSSPARLPRTRLESAAEFLDGTAEGMRRAILEIGKYEWLVYEAKSAAAYHDREEAAKKEMEYDGEGKDGTEHNIGGGKEDVVSGGADSGLMNDSNGAHDEPEREVEVEADEEANWMKFKATRREAHTISRDIYVDLLTLFYMQKCKKSPESVSAKADHSGKLLDHFKVMKMKNILHALMI